MLRPVPGNALVQFNDCILLAWISYSCHYKIFLSNTIFNLMLCHAAVSEQQAYIFSELSAVFPRSVSFSNITRFLWMVCIIAPLSK